MRKVTRLVSLRCKCGKLLDPPIRGAGEVEVTASRSCSCGLTWDIVLWLVGYTREVPSYRLLTATVSDEAQL